MTFTRVLTAVVLAPAVTALVWWAPSWLITLALGGVTLLALHEFFALAGKAGLPGFFPWTAISAAVLLYAQWTAVNVVEWFGGQSAKLVARGQEPHRFDAFGAVVIFLLGTTACGLLSRKPLPEVFRSLAGSVTGYLFVAAPLSCLVLLLAFDVTGRFGWNQGLGRRLVLFTLFVVWVGDTVAYFAGRALGRNKLAPAISPGKTWEGAIGNVLGAVLVAGAFARWMPVPVGHLIVVAVLASAAGQLGDLTESIYKRAAGVKDSGTLLPGHGGVLDRIDALIFAAPAVWAYVTYVVR